MPAFPTTGPITVTLDVSVANIHLSVVERAEATVEVLPTNASRTTDVTAAERTRVEFIDGIVRIATPRQPRLAGRTRSVDIAIQVPADSTVRGEAAIGRLQTVGRLAACHFTVRAGDITVDRADVVTLHTDMGRVVVGHVTTSASITTADGDARIVEAAGGSVEVRTQRGNIDVGVSNDAAVQLITGTMHGTVSNSLSADHDGRRTTGHATIDVRATSGDIAVHRFTDNATPVNG